MRAGVRPIPLAVEYLGAAAALIAYVILLGLAPSPELGFVLQFLGLGGMVGTLIAYIKERRDSTTNTWRITATGALYGGFLGLAIVVLDQVLSALR